MEGRHCRIFYTGSSRQKNVAFFLIHCLTGQQALYERSLMQLQSFVVKAVRLVLRSSSLHLCKVSTHFLLTRALTTASHSSRFQKQPEWGSKKHKIKKKLHLLPSIMADPKIEEILAPLRAAVKEQVFIHAICHLLLSLFFTSFCPTG